MDSLSFRNQQLAKRVELLQEELAVSEAKGKKGKVIMRGNKGETQLGRGNRMYSYSQNISFKSDYEICQLNNDYD